MERVTRRGSPDPSVSRLTGPGISSWAIWSCRSGLFLLAGASGGPGSVNGKGDAARFAGPFGVAFDRSGNLFVGDLELQVGPLSAGRGIWRSGKREWKG